MLENQDTETLGEMLLREGLISHDQLDEAMVRQKSTGKSIGHILVEMGVITESVKMSFLKKKFGYEFFSLENKSIDSLVLSLISRTYAFKYHLVPVRVEHGVLVVAMDDPSDLALLDNLKTTVGMPLRPVIASTADIDEALKQYPESQEEEIIVISSPPSSFYRLLSYVSFPIMGFLPLLVFIILLRFSDAFLRWATKITEAGSSFSFDVFLYTLLGWGLWIIIMWEINGLIFSDKKGETVIPTSHEEYEE